ncbi:hypothetical protein, partial [Citrobacter sp. Igbk 17]
IKNRVFSDKCKHYEDSIFPETKNIFELSKNGNYWNVEIIEQRGKDIARKAPSIWPLSFC